MIEEITKNIEWLKKNSSSNDLVGKLRVAEELATNSYYLATLVGDAYQEKNSTEFFWKSAVNTDVALTTGPTGKNEALAKDKYKHLYKEHLDADSKYRRLALLMSQTNTVIEQVRQTCSFLKQEYRHNGA